MRHAFFALAALPLLGAGDAALIQPGKWENRAEILTVDMPGAPPRLLAAMKGRPQVITSCVTPAQAALGPRDLLNRDRACRFTRYDARGGRIATEMVCTRPTGTMRATSSGRYTLTSYEVSGSMVMTGRARMTMTTRTTGRRLGPC
ncbi:MAG: hypothetical protein A4S12_08805 [Proteobacteria bacterium SG_bin5]|nr:DUF3617 domain-containing protein [Sphingomonas sp.]OQW41191.1 MAG: hypothetical protein A4S12_08805 [Proteobacteria bacterium SG_bin5]